MNKVMIIAPHPDDETLGCGGTILRHISNGDDVYWCIITTAEGLTTDRKWLERREEEIAQVTSAYGFKNVFKLNFVATKLDSVPDNNLINAIGDVFKEIKPNVVYVPYRGDIHSDHKIVYDATMSCTKWFRFPSIEKVLIYETISETNFAMNIDSIGFRPNVFSNISGYINKKVEIMNIYESEIASHPFPRSEGSIRALAVLRGATAGVDAAEAFMLVKERIL
ncbi:PIG-L deacetylase family protein [Sporosarcina gallistercoris]|uniref:PIG-L family deacetylase n=1 Tax=Sporosarcina gallistercoris TaxID=2762245 RepID=A0ABR8PN60_9BACL|nr:PIG-L family deacetylase [Sporosarcina gallistercoris]MBD7909615.1 PIG-L family deacetylase [Sporosarcina gallistercoris]